MPSRRVDDRIRELSIRATTTPDEEVEPVLRELQGAIRDKIELVRELAAKKFLGANGSFQDRPFQDRRTTEEEERRLPHLVPSRRKIGS